MLLPLLVCFWRLMKAGDPFKLAEIIRDLKIELLARERSDAKVGDRLKKLNQRVEAMFIQLKENLVRDDG